MRKFLLLLPMLLISAAISLNAQVKTPAPSPSCKIEQKVGLTDVTIEYSRPGIKDREIFGGLVQYGEVWRTGANAATQITFSTDVKVNGNDLKAGKYVILTIPNPDSWEVHFYEHSSNRWSTYIKDDAAEPAARFNAQAFEFPGKVESFMIVLDNLRNSSADLWILWDKTSVALQLEVPTDDAVEKSIAATMDGPSGNDYYSAAVYYLQEGKDLNQALKWINTSLEKNGDRFWMLRQKSLIQAGLGDKSGALETAKKSLEMATEAGNNDYVRMNEASIKEWSMD